MNQRLLVPGLLLGMLVALGAVGQADAVTRCVNPKGTLGCFSSVQDAVNHSVSGDVILIAAGRYREAVSINVAGLKMVGPLPSAGKAIIDPYNEGVVNGIEVSVDNVILKRLTVQNSQGNGIVIGGNNATLANLTISGTETTGTTNGALLIQGNGASVDSSAIVRSDGNCIQVVGDNVSITNSTARQCNEVAIEITGNAATVSANTVGDAYDGGIVIAGDNATVSKNNVNSIDDYGIDVTGAAPSVTQNVVKATYDPGFFIDCTGTCSSALVNLNTAQDITDDDGFELNASTAGMMVTNNTAARAMFSCFDILGGTGIALQNNKASACGYGDHNYGFDIAGTGHTLTSNVASGNHGSGFRLCNATSVTLTTNTASGNYASGIELSPSSCTNSDVTLTGNTVTDNARNGILIESTAADTEVEENASSGNRTDYCNASGTTVFGTGNNFGTQDDAHCIF